MAYSTFTLAQIRDLLETRWDAVPFWTDTEALNAINEALLFWNQLTGFWRIRVTLTTTANNWDYQLPASLVFGTRVEYTSQPFTAYSSKPLGQTSLHEIDNAHPGWQGQTTTTGGNVPTAPHFWFPLSIDMIGIWPATAVTGGLLTVDGVSATPQLVNDTDFIQIGSEELNAILGYALHSAAFKEGGERFLATMPYLNAFLLEAAEENDQLNDSAIFRHFIGTDMNRQENIKRGLKTDYDALSSGQYLFNQQWRGRTP